MTKANERSELLLGRDSIQNLQTKWVLVVGVGGVGGMCIEALARSGIGHLVLVDRDIVEASNINRQLVATFESVGRKKVEVWKERIASLAPKTQVVAIHGTYDGHMNEVLDQYPIDFVVDCIDSISSKQDLIRYALDRNIPFICSMGMARRKDPCKIQVMELEKTSYDPMAKRLRVWKRKERIRKKIMVAASSEIPVKVEAGEPLPSMMFVPAAAGLALAHYCVEQLKGSGQ
ncbi:ThiF family adenylyltransferase [Dubosiella muris]|uniref:tRNA threonylcarbamoyladenosine dehydratase n=1 Tax=Dubosiella muris TaxID=3038133 RepID=A0AC61R7P5_9FIRM|nr:ThiF family adenylyltransferase [Dubosiella muris]TGY65936.1 tRNA threonylcarbamoyladenosine dehydratase [Dubosiella muris]